jgi:glycosyltransferase involved in cell wall biosynthesis
MDDAPPSDGRLIDPASDGGPREQRIWVTWERQRRNASLSGRLGAQLVECLFDGGRLRRYLALSVRTLRLLWSTSARVVFVQNPSLVLTALAVTLRPFRSWRLVVDAHNAGVYPFEHGKRLSVALATLLFRGADLTIVSNERLAAYVTERGGRAFALPDPLPALGVADPPGSARDGCQVVFICTWAADEPYLEVLEAARGLDPSIQVLVTGKSRGRERAAGGLPANVTLTGFVPEQAFERLLREADVVMDLTTREDCLVCGAYEAVAVGRPMVLSDTRALRSYFRMGSVFADNTATGIRDAIVEACANVGRLREEVIALGAELEREWQERKRALERILAGL